MVFPKPKVNIKNRPNIPESKRVFISETLHGVSNGKKDWALIYLNEGWDDYVSDYRSTMNPYVSGDKADLWDDGFKSALKYFV